MTQLSIADFLHVNTFYRLWGKCTLMLPFISFLTTAKAVDPKRSYSLTTGDEKDIPNIVTSDSEASRNWEVSIPLSVISTFSYDRLMLSKKVAMVTFREQVKRNKTRCKTRVAKVGGTRLREHDATWTRWECPFRSWKLPRGPLAVRCLDHVLGP